LQGSNNDKSKDTDQSQRKGPNSRISFIMKILSTNIYTSSFKAIFLTENSKPNCWPESFGDKIQLAFNLSDIGLTFYFLVWRKWISFELICIHTFSLHSNHQELGLHSVHLEHIVSVCTKREFFSNVVKERSLEH